MTAPGFACSTFPFEPDPRRRPIAVLMSGGVDSSVTALLLHEAGWQVVGVTLRLPQAAEAAARRPCCGIDASVVCRQMDWSHYHLDARQVFTDGVIQPFRTAYAAGVTPSPCIDCNTRVKFGWAWQAVERAFGIPHLATGHYSCVAETGGGTGLARGCDHQRDQSYFLYGIARERLPFLHLPLAGCTKDGVRRLAAAAGLTVAGKPDSMDLCFAGEDDYRHALAGGAGRPGEIQDTAGRVLGRHPGIGHYTPGQRRGLGIAAAERLYVVRILPEKNVVVLGTRAEAFTRDVAAGSVNVLMPEALAPEQPLWGKVRSAGEPEPCELLGYGGGRLRVRFRRPVFAPAPGQHLVLYQRACGQEWVVAGGTILQ